MNFDQIVNATKEKAVWLGDKAGYYGSKAFDKSKEYGGKAYDKVSHKVTSGQLKKDAKEIGSKVKKGALGLWGALVNKFEEVNGSKKEQQPLNENTQEKK